jgi:hypothetical protein
MNERIFGLVEIFVTFCLFLAIYYNELYFLYKEDL